MSASQSLFYVTLVYWLDERLGVYSDYAPGGNAAQAIERIERQWRDKHQLIPGEEPPYRIAHALAMHRTVASQVQ